MPVSSVFIERAKILDADIRKHVLQRHQDSGVYRRPEDISDEVVVDTFLCWLAWTMAWRTLTDDNSPQFHQEVAKYKKSLDNMSENGIVNDESVEWALNNVAHVTKGVFR